MRWQDDQLTREKYLRAADEVFDETPQWQADMLNGLRQRGGGLPGHPPPGPGESEGVDPERIVAPAPAPARR